MAGRGDFGITEVEVEVIGANSPAEPQALAELVAMEPDRLPAAAVRILDALIEAHPDGLDREELAERCGLTASGGTFGAAVGMLRKYALAESTGRELRACDVLVELKEAREALKVALKKLDDGVDLGAPAQTLGLFLERWLADSVRPRLAPKTHKTYRDLMRVHVIPVLGTTRLDRLTAQQVATLLSEKADEGLSPATVGHIRSVLRNALNRAVRWNLIVRNPVVLTDPPRQEKRHVVPLAPEEARIILEAAKGHRLEALFTVALFLGLRQGEILGLRWADTDLEAGTLSVTQALQRVDGALILKAPKTEKSRRRLTLPSSVVTALRAHRDRQAFERQAIGDHWKESGLVFTTTIGTAIDPRNVLRIWQKLLADAGLPKRTFHVTRHTAVSVLIDQGVPLKVIQEILGHSVLSTTADVYGHLFPQAFTEAAEAMERALGKWS